MSPSRWQAALRRLVGETAEGLAGEPTDDALAAAQEREAQLDELEAVTAGIAPELSETLAASTPAAESAAAPQVGIGRPADREYDEMGDRLTCSAEGIGELILEAIADDARILLTPGSGEIRVQLDSDDDEGAQLMVDGPQARFVGGVAKRVEVPPGLAITIDEALGDVRVRGLDTPLRVRSVHGDLRLENVTGRVEVDHAQSDAQVEGVAALRLGTCAGDLRFSGGELEVEMVAGDARIERAAAVRGGRVHGDLSAERVEGDLEIGAVYGDARLSDVSGAAQLGLVAGDLRAASARGGLTAGQVHGDAQLVGPFRGRAYTVNANGDVDIRLAADDDVRLSVRALGRIRSNLPLTPNSDGTASYAATLADGKTPITLSCSGDLRIDAAGRGDSKRNWERRWGPSPDSFAELNGLGDRIRQQVTASLAAAGINPETGEININLGQGRGRAGRGRGPDPARPPVPPSPPQPPKPSTSGEQMTILKMLEEGRITPEEADALLRALGA